MTSTAAPVLARHSAAGRGCLAVDATSEPRIEWLAYGADGAMWAAAYLDGRLLRHDGVKAWTAGQLGQQNAVEVDERLHRRLRASCPHDGVPVWPEQVRLLRNGRLELVTVASVRREAVRWLWVGRLAAGKLVVLDGDPGLGKSTVSIDLTARLTTGSPMPDGGAAVPAMDVVLLSAEDGVADTIRPRLEAARGDLERVHVVTSMKVAGEPRPFTVPDDLVDLEEAIEDKQAGFVVIDPFTAYLSSEVNSWKDQDVRRALFALTALAERTGACILVVRHLTKSNGVPAIYRGGGSIAIIGQARIGLVIAADKGDDERRILAVSKSNLGVKPSAFAYRLIPEEEFDCARVAWEGPVEGSADELLSHNGKDDDQASEQISALKLAKRFLLVALADGHVPTTDLQQQAKDAGVAWGTVRRASDELGVDAFQHARRWHWRLPENRTERSEAQVLAHTHANT